MDADLFAESIEYERLTQSIYQAMLDQEGQTIEVKHNVDVTGRSGVAHQVDVLWRFRLAGVEHTVLVECKNYASAVTLEKIRNFFAVLHDVGNCAGLMVTKTGYQAGVCEFADYYKLGLKLLRAPTEQDWEGKVRNIHLHINAKGVLSTEDRPIRINVDIATKGADDRKRIQVLQNTGRLFVDSPATLVFWSKDKQPITEELRWWLPRQLNVLDKDDGGPYEQRIELPDHYILCNPGEHDEELVRVRGLDVTYHVETIEDAREVILYGEEVVQAVLRDVASGEIEYVKHKDD